MPPPNLNWVKIGRKLLYALHPGAQAKVWEESVNWAFDLFEREANARAMVLDEPERDLTPDDPPSFFLREQFQIVPFAGRKHELEQLSAWALDNSKAVSVALLTGGPGCGKSRLTRRLCETAYEEWCDPHLPPLWLAGPIKFDELPDPASVGIAQATHFFTPLNQWNGPVFIIVDYAERHGRYVEALLKAAANSDRGEHQFRVLLVARSEGDWLRELHAKFADRLPESNPFYGSPNIALPHLTIEPSEHDREFTRAFGAFRELLFPDLSSAKPKTPRVPEFQEDVEALDIHTAALLTAFGEDLPARAKEEDLLEALLLREQKKHWKIAAANEQLDETLSGEPLTQAIAWLAMIGDVADDNEAQDRTKDVHDWSDQKNAQISAAIAAIKHVYPGEGDNWWSGVRPDRVASYLARSVPTKALSAAAPQLTLSQLESALTHLTWSHQRALDDSHREQEKSRMDVLIRCAAPSGILAAFSAARAYGDPCGRIAAEVMSDAFNSESNDEILVIAKQIHDSAPKHTTALRELAALAAQVLAVREKDEAVRARYLTDLGNRLAALGRREEALAAAEEAVQIRRKLAEACPDAFLAGLAKSLSNLGRRFSALGRREEALATAEEAVNIFRKFDEIQPDTFLPDLAMSLSNLGIELSALGRREEALAATKEAVQIRRRLADARPDAFLPDLAMSVNNLGRRFSALGRREEALAATEEAVDIFRKFSEARPDAFLPDLAMSVSNLGIELSALGLREEALAATEEAVNIYRKLAEARPDAFLPDMAMSLNNLGRRFSALGRREEALAATEEAVRIRRELAEARPDAFLPNLATSVSNLGIELSALGRREEALAATEEAVNIYRKLAEARPDAFLPGLARSLGTLGTVYTAADSYPAAANVYREGIESLSEPFRQTLQAHAALMSFLVDHYSQACEQSEEDLDQALIGPIQEKLAELEAESGASAVSDDEPDPA